MSILLNQTGSPRVASARVKGHRLVDTPQRDSLVLRSKCFHGEKPVLVRRPFRTAPRPPETISECRRVLLFGFASAAIACRGVRISRSWQQVILICMLEHQSGPFMSGEVIFLPVMLRAGAVGMGREVMVLRRYLVRFLHTPRHCTSSSVVIVD